MDLSCFDNLKENTAFSLKSTINVCAELVFLDEYNPGLNMNIY